MKIAIIGAGMAGCALGYALKYAGEEPVIYEAGPSLAGGASGNSVGLYNPRFTAQRTPESDYFTSAFSLALRIFEQLDGIEWNPCGALHLINDEKKEKRFSQVVENWGWGKNQLRLINSADASEIAGVDLNYKAMYLARSGCVSPKKLCEAYARDIDVRLDTQIDSLKHVEADIVILAGGPGVRKFLPTLPIGCVRGQITEVQASERSRDVNCTICYGGYFSPALNDRHIVGSTFQRWLDHSDLIEQDDIDNIKKLAGVVPGLEQGLKIIGQRASVRATSKDHFPIVGKIHDGLYVSAAHGSHGILSSLMAAHLISDMILERSFCLGMDTVSALSAQRFLSFEHN